MFIKRKHYVLCALVMFLGITTYYWGLRPSYTRRVQIKKIQKSKTVPFKYTDPLKFLIDTPGCYIPNYSMNYKYKRNTVKSSAIKRLVNNACQERAIFVQVLGNNMFKFRINKLIMRRYTDQNYACCYRFVRPTPGRESNTLTYTKCQHFEDGARVALTHEIISVACNNNGEGNETGRIYDDVYIILKKLDLKDRQINSTKWNVLLIGLDSMSRARVYDTMPQTTTYLHIHKWLDFRGYQKVESNTFPNLMSVLTGKKMSTIYSKCKNGLYKCADYFIWEKYKKSGYITAYGEDYLSLPDTFSKFNGFKTKPTDHYMRPFYLTGERRYKNIVCTKKKPSTVHMLQYAHSFIDSYKNNSFFGMFWINSYTYNIFDNPSLLDGELASFFMKLNKTGALNNTFIIFFSDHGTRFGKMRLPVQSYYDARLPMLFLWAPSEFRLKFSKEFSNLQLNQKRLTTPYDLYVTLADILSLSTNSSDATKSEACPQCTSLFKAKSPNRTCADAGVKDNWCSCHNMSKFNDTRTEHSLQLAAAYIQNIWESIKTIPCMFCKQLKTPTLLRAHVYDSNNKTFHVIAFDMSRIRFETVIVHDGKISKVLSLQSISAYNTRGNCVLNPNDRPFCICASNEKCFNKTNVDSVRPVA